MSIQTTTFLSEAQKTFCEKHGFDPIEKITHNGPVTRQQGINQIMYSENMWISSAFPYMLSHMANFPENLSKQGISNDYFNVFQKPFKEDSIILFHVGQSLGFICSNEIPQSMINAIKNKNENIIVKEHRFVAVKFTNEAKIITKTFISLKQFVIAYENSIAMNGMNMFVIAIEGCKDFVSMSGKKIYETENFTNTYKEYLKESAEKIREKNKLVNLSDVFENDEQIIEFFKQEEDVLNNLLMQERIKSMTEDPVQLMLKKIMSNKVIN